MKSAGRTDALIGVGTAVSRLTGLVRTIVLVGLIGSNRSTVADAFGIANQLPNSIFEIISVGVLTAVIVPQIVRSSAHADGGNSFVSKLYTLTLAAFIGATAIAMVCAPWLVSLQIQPGNSAQIALATAFAYWCLPQVFFYGMYALVGETLNARRIYGPYTWVPAVNNLISIAGFLALSHVFGANLTHLESWTPVMVSWLGGIATSGIALQAVVLLFFWRRTGLSLRPDFHWKGMGLGALGRAASWTLLMVLSSLVAAYFQSWVVTHASGEGPAVAVMSNAWLIFMVPYSVLVHSVGTTYFTRISEHATGMQSGAIKSDFSSTVKRLGLLLIGGLAALAVSAVPASRVFTNTSSDAVEASAVLLAYLVGLVPLGVLYLVQRTFYAYGDTRTPFIYNLLQCALVIATSAAALSLVESTSLGLNRLALVVVLGQALASALQVAVALLLLRRKIGGLGIVQWAPALVRFTLVALPAAGSGWLVYGLAGGDQGWMVLDKFQGALGTILVGGTVIAVYFGLLAAGQRLKR